MFGDLERSSGFYQRQIKEQNFGGRASNISLPFPASARVALVGNLEKTPV